MLKKISIAFASLAILLVTFLIGAYWGMVQGYIHDSPGRAVLLAAELKLLRANKVEETIKMKETLLDVEIANATELKKSFAPDWLFFPFVDESDSYLNKVANYRKQYPSQNKEKDIVEINQRFLDKYGNLDVSN